jgi:hypothetical protein
MQGQSSQLGITSLIIIIRVIITILIIIIIIISRGSTKWGLHIRIFGI